MKHKKDTIPTCRMCGCTDTSACHDPATGKGCYWVEIDLCSACATPQQKKKSSEAIQEVINGPQPKLSKPLLMGWAEKFLYLISGDKAVFKIEEQIVPWPKNQSRYIYRLKCNDAVINSTYCCCLNLKPIGTDKKRWKQYIDNNRNHAIKDLFQTSLLQIKNDQHIY